VDFSKIFLHPRFSNGEIKKKKTPLLKRVDFKIGFYNFLKIIKKGYQGERKYLPLNRIKYILIMGCKYS